MTEIEKKAREIAVNMPLGSRDLCEEREEAARLGIIEGLEMAAKWHDGQSKIHDDYADQEWADRAAEKVYRRRANEHTNYAKQIRSIIVEDV